MVTVTGTVTLKNSRDRVEEMMEMVLPGFDAFNVNRRGGAIVMQLVSTEVDPKTMEAKLSKQAVLHLSKDSIIGIQESTYRVEFDMDSDFGMPGAITVRNKYDKEVFLESIDIEDFVHFSCNSWVQPDMVHPEKRFFFSNKACLPCQTPLGLKEPREEDLRQLRGEDQKGVRKFGDRVYDYDLYNDLGNPDDGNEHARPILGTKRYPHPLRCRTGRPSTITELKAESRVKEFAQTYVPRDEAFRGVRKEALDQEMFKSMTRNLIPFIKTHASKYGAFKHLSEITSIYKGKSEMKSKEEGKLGNTTKLPLPMDLIKLKDSAEEYFKFNIPNIITRVDCCGIGDEEFGRQILAGVNPLSIKRLETFPPMSQLDPFIYGPQESSLREEHIIPHLEGMSIHQAMAKKKLFVLDYHDTFLPFLKGMNALEDRKAYATRTIFFLTKAETLKPIAIELSLPQGYQDRPAKQVLTPPVDATSRWLWQLGKAHVCSNDAGVHQLVHHWLRTHACMEPFIIAAHRQLSAMHPIFKLLKPHMKHTLQINAMAREALINGEGIIESDFSVGRYSTEILSAAYRDWWRFDMESLPADLVRRGVAEPDPNAAHGLKLLIKDYPYVNDGLLIWSALENFVGTYVNYYYHDGPAVQFDTELQAWYHEAIAVGHVNHRDASWWPKLSSQVISPLFSPPSYGFLQFNILQ
ncbi:hypothetical protein L6164_036675 [Bauhinia variegata]|uniref:Uncharacterized protein n=1 Tax=Bauhinia variegata TaxID=167791 RepID=A0ACB9KHU4_BAUVA|nr:hypothetical protein L6164_036675 [Bauhinia variegata]